MPLHAPIAVFIYNRPDHLRSTLGWLSQCDGFADSPVIVFGDGPKRADQVAQVEAARGVARELLGARADYRFSPVNKGLARSIIDGVNAVVAEHGRVIVVEDDLQLAPGFLVFMNAALEKYADNEQVYQVSGYAADAPELLESAIRKISVYLDKNHIPLHAADPGGLLVLATYRALKRLARRRGQSKSTEQDSALAEVLRAPDWREEVDRRLFLERLGRELDEKTRAILRLRISGAGWKEIARVQQMNVPAVRRNFWRNIRRAYLRLLCMPESTPRSSRGDSE